MPSKWGREEQGMARSHPTTPPPPPGLLLLDVLTSSSSPPPKRTRICVTSEPSQRTHRFGSVAVGREVALTADELDAEWRAVMKKEKERVDTARAAIEALVTAYDWDCRQHATVVEELEEEVDTLRE